MRNVTRQLLGWFGIMGLLLVGLESPAMALTYQVTVDTSTLSGTTGYVDLQFNPGTIAAPGAQAALSSFGGPTLISNDPQTGATGSVTGALPGPLVFSNTTQYNDFFQAVTFGTTTSFNVNFTGAFTTASSGSNTTFSLSFYDATGTNPIFTTDPSGFGSILRMDLAPGGGITTFNTAIIPSAVSVAAVPVPAAVVLFGSGLVGLLGWQRKRLSKTV
jgi:hypothetical protein